MASIAFPSLAKKAKLGDGTQYGYVYVPAQPSKPTVLLLHGFPSSSYDWRHQIVHLPRAGYGVLAPDLLGYGDTDKPSDVESYKTQNIGAHVIELLGKENLDEVIGVGHDFGSYLLTRLAIEYRSRFSAIAFIAVGFMDPSIELSIDAINAATQAQGEKGTFGYISFFVTTEDAASLMDGARESVDCVIYAADHMEFWRNLGPLGALESFVRERKTLPVAEFIPSEEMEMHSKILLVGGFTGPLNWYKALVKLGPSEEDKALTAEQKTLSVPTMMMVTEKDYIVMPEMQLQNTAQWAEKLEVVRIDTGHWAMLEKREEFEEALEKWLAAL